MAKPRQLPSLAEAAWLKDDALQALFAMLARAGGEGRAVGGAVRNSLLGQPVHEVDIATTLAPDAVVQGAQRAGFGVHPTGIEHGTVTVVVQGKPFEVTTLRRDVATDGRHAVVAFGTNWEEDAARRDFSMNALYADAAGKIFDYTDGYKDLLKRKVRFVGKPSRRIREDYLRILRFFRFHAQYGKGAVNAEGLSACVRLRAGLRQLSAERLRQELLKLLAAPGAVPTLKLMARNRILREILPHTEEWRVLGRLPPDGVLRLYVLAADVPGLKDRLRLSNAQAERLLLLQEAPELSPALRPEEQRRMLYQLGAEAWRDAVWLSRARAPSRQEDAGWADLMALADDWQAPQFPLTGADLKANGFMPGPAMGQALRGLEDWWVASDFKPGKDDLLQRAQRYKPQSGA